MVAIGINRTGEHPRQLRIELLMLFRHEVANRTLRHPFHSLTHREAFLNRLFTGVERRGRGYGCFHCDAAPCSESETRSMRRLLGRR